MKKPWPAWGSNPVPLDVKPRELPIGQAGLVGPRELKFGLYLESNTTDGFQQLQAAAVSQSRVIMVTTGRIQILSKWQLLLLLF